MVDKSAAAFLESLGLNLEMKESGEEDGVDSLRLGLTASGLDKKGLTGSRDPYVVLAQVKPDGSRVRVHQSPVVKGTRDPKWPAENLYLPLLCNSDPDQPLVAEVWDFNKSGAHELLGETAPVTVNELVDAADTGAAFPLRDPKRVGKKGYDKSGVLGVSAAEAYTAPRVQEYLDGGLRFKCMVAVDFTSANGSPSSSEGLHFLGEPGSGSVVSNPYAATLAVLTSVVQKLNGNRGFPAYGFGGTPAGSKSSPGLFSLKAPADASSDAMVGDASELVDAYRAAVSSVTPVSTRNYVPVLRAALERVAAEGPLSQQNQHYTLVALLTCGPMDDVEATVQELLTATQLPVTVLIVGVGPDEATIEQRFVGVRALDEQLAGLHNKKVMAVRDNVTFIPMPANAPRVDSAAGLASVALTSGCDQLVNYMQMKEVQPGSGPEAAAAASSAAAPPASASAAAAAAPSANFLIDMVSPPSLSRSAGPGWPRLVPSTRS